MARSTLLKTDMARSTRIDGRTDGNGLIDSPSNPDQYIYTLWGRKGFLLQMGSEALPSTYYILSDESRIIPFNLYILSDESSIHTFRRI